MKKDLDGEKEVRERVWGGWEFLPAALGRRIRLKNLSRKNTSLKERLS
jgi:hypothetical protein